MELKQYIQIVRKRWWLALGAVVITTIATLIFVAGQPSIYESTGTFVVRPRTAISEDAVRAIDTLSARVEINTTYASIARSRVIKDRAVERLDLKGSERSSLTVNGKVVTGTNLLEIGVQGRDPEMVGEFATVVSEEAISYVAGLDDAFELEMLDPPAVPKRPIAPNKRFTVVLGGMLGVMLGIGLALLAEYLDWPSVADESGRGPRRSKRSDRFNIVDRETGAYNSVFFDLRFQEELTRADRTGSSVLVGFVKVSTVDGSDGFADGPGSGDLRRTVEDLQPIIRDEDLLAYTGDATFAVMLPDVAPDEADQMMAEWRDELNALTAADEEDQRTRVSVGTCAYGGDGLEITGAQIGDPSGDEDELLEEEGATTESGQRDVVLKILPSD